MEIFDFQSYVFFLFNVLVKTFVTNVFKKIYAFSFKDFSIK